MYSAYVSSPAGNRLMYRCFYTLLSQHAFSITSVPCTQSGLARCLHEIIIWLKHPLNGISHCYVLVYAYVCCVVCFLWKQCSIKRIYERIKTDHRRITAIVVFNLEDQLYVYIASGVFMVHHSHCTLQLMPVCVPMEVQPSAEFGLKSTCIMFPPIVLLYRFWKFMVVVLWTSFYGHDFGCSTTFIVTYII